MTPHVKRIRSALSLVSGRRVGGMHDGVHASLRTGTGMDFNDLREYVSGDEVGDIDWRASARHGSLMVRRHFAQRRTTLMLAVATGAPLAAMASPTATKCEVALEAAGTLGVLATNHGDQVGMVWWDGTAPRIVPPSTRDVALGRLLQTLEQSCRTDRPGADVPALLDMAGRGLRMRGIVALIADDVGLDPAVVGRLRQLRSRHEVMVVTVSDLDPTHPVAAAAGVHAVTSARAVSYLHDQRLAREVSEARAARSALRRDVLGGAGIAHVDVDSPSDVAGAVVDMVRRRPRARR